MRISKIFILTIMMFCGTNHVFAGSISSTRDYQNKYLDKTFWNDRLGPFAGGEVAKAMFAPNSVYTKNRNTNGCNYATMNEVYIYAVPGTIPSVLSGNTVYILQKGVHKISNSLMLSGSCIGLISEDNSTITAVNPGTFPTNVDTFGLKTYLYHQTNTTGDNIIISNLTLDGANSIDYGFFKFTGKIRNSSIIGNTFMGFINDAIIIISNAGEGENLLIDNSKFYNNNIGIYNTDTNTSINNSIFQNNYIGITILGPSGNKGTISNSIFQNNYYGIDLGNDDNIVYNSQIYSNNIGINISNGGDNNHLYNLDIFNNGTGISNQSVGVNTYNGEVRFFSNKLNYTGLLVEGRVGIPLLPAYGSLISGQDTMSCNWTAQPINSLGQTLQILPSVSNMPCNFTGLNLGRSPTNQNQVIYFPKVRKQSQSLRRNGSNLVNSDTPRSNTLYITDKQFGGTPTPTGPNISTVSGMFESSTFEIPMNFNVSVFGGFEPTTLSRYIITGATNSSGIVAMTNTYTLPNTNSFRYFTTQFDIGLGSPERSNIYATMITVKDNTPPSIPFILSPLSGSLVTNPVTITRSTSVDTGAGLSGYLLQFTDGFTSRGTVVTGNSYTTGFTTGTYSVSILGFDKMNIFFGLGNATGTNTGNTFTITGIAIDNIPPTINIFGPQSGTGSSKSISGTLSESGTLSYYTTNSTTCDSSITPSSFSTISQGADITFTTTGDNGKYICFRGVDTVGNTGFGLSNQITGITINTNDTTAPIISVTNPDVTPSSSKIFSAIMDDVGVMYRSIIAASSNCDSSVGAFTTGSSVTVDNSAYNGQKVCFRGINTVGLIGYGVSNTIQGINSTLSITINQPSTSASTSKTITASSSSGSTLYKLITQGTLCDSSIGNFETYSSITFTSVSDNGKRVCYKATDSSNNTIYKLSEAIQGIEYYILPFSSGDQNLFNADYCPEGDFSNSLYDGLCGSIVPVYVDGLTAAGDYTSCPTRPGKYVDIYFRDISYSPYSKEILRLLNLCYITGYPPYSNFGPQQQPTISEFIAVLIRILENDKGFDPADYSKKKYFSDVKSNYRNAGFLNKAYELGITQGIQQFGTNGLRYIKPDKYISISEATDILTRVFVKLGYSVGGAQQLIQNTTYKLGTSLDRGKMTKLFHDLFNLGTQNNGNNNNLLEREQDFISALVQRLSSLNYNQRRQLVMDNINTIQNTTDSQLNSMGIQKTKLLQMLNNLYNQIN